jgi:carbon monoxide dehydrogenase subunit G
MELTGQQLINASREKVYAALNDPEVLKQCIPGCEELNKTSDTQMDATVSIKVGPVKARFKGEVELTNLNPPESYTIVGEGKGGAAGFAKGGADVKLTEQGDQTMLDYAVKADIGGKLAQLGGRLIDGTAKKLSGEFFEKFGEIVGEGEPAEIEGAAGVQAPAAAAEAAVAAEASKPSGSGSRITTIALVIVAICVFYVVFIAGLD